MSGDGNGPAAPYMTPRPRDFRQGRFKIRTTETGSLPTDDDIERSIRQGMRIGDAGRQPFLSDADVDVLVAKVKSFSARFQTEQPKVVTLGPEVPSSPESIAAGKEVFDRLLCSGCHGTDGAGADAVATDFDDDWGRPMRATNLTEPWTFRGGATPRDIHLRFRTGMNGSPMPSFATAATNPEMWNLANYVASMARKPVWKMTADEVKAFTRHRTRPRAPTPSVADVPGQIDGLRRLPHADPPRRLAHRGIVDGRGMRWTIVPFGDRFTANLTSDKETGLGNVSDDLIKRTLTKGLRRDGTRMLPYPMPWTASG